MKDPLHVVALLVLCSLLACGSAPAARPAAATATGDPGNGSEHAAVEGLSTLVPADVTLFGELRYLKTAIDAWLPGQDGLALAGDYLAGELGVSPRALTELLRSIEGLGVAMRESAGETQIAVLLKVSRSGPLEQLLADAPFRASGGAPSGGERYLLSDETLERLEMPPGDAPTLTLFSGGGLLIVGTAQLADAIGEVQAGGAPSLASSAAFIEASGAFVRNGVNAYLDVASLVSKDNRKAQGLLDAVLAQRTPIVATMTVEPEQRLTIHAGLSGTAMPDERLYVAPPALDLARRLPRETVAYQAYSSRFGLRGEALARSLVSLLTTLNPDTPARVRELENELGIPLPVLLDALGGQGVIGLLAPWKLRPDDEPSKQLAFVWVQQLAGGAAADTLVRKIAAKVQSVPGREGVRVSIERREDLLVVAAGEASLVERSLEALLNGKDTLHRHKSHERSLRSLEGSQLVMWLDTQRVMSMLAEAFPDAGRQLAMLQRAGGPDAVSGAMAFSWRLDQDLWRLRLDMLDASTVGMLAALSIYGVRRYLASSKAAEAKNTVGAMSRAAAAAYEREQVGGGHALCKSAAPVPAAVPAGMKYQPRQTAGEDWNSGDERTGWRCLKFAMSRPHYYRYRYVAGGGYLGPQHGFPDPGPSGFEAIAEGDLDGDGVTSLFIRQGKVDPRTGNLVLSSQLLIVNEFE